MLPGSRRYLLVIALLMLGVGLTWGQRITLAARMSSELPTSVEKADAAAGPQSELIDAETATQFTYFLDVEGWYRITPYETVVRSPYDLTADSSEQMSEALPVRIGEWEKLGEDSYVGDDPAVIFYLKNPTVALQRTYQDPSGQSLNLGLLANKGDESFLLFSHTPETCYPGRLWQVVESRRESALLDDKPMYAQYLLTEHLDTGEKLMVLYWYAWDNPQRDSRDGVLSVRVNLVYSPDESDEHMLDRAWDFVREMYPATVPWDRF
jgi:hypothetical protein